VIAARLDVLAPEQKSLLQQAAVIGKVFWLGALESDDSSRRELEERLHALERKEFVRRERRSSVEGDSEYVFLHVLLRDAAYSQIPRAERAEKHERAAQWIEKLGRSEDTAEMLAHHYVQALEYARASGRDSKEIEEPARRALGDAGARAYALNAYEAAERFTTAALELAEPGSPEWSRLLLQRARAAWQWRMFEAGPLFENARSELEEAGYAEAAAEAGALASWAAWIGGDRARAKAATRHASDLLESAPPSRAKAAVLNELGRLLAMEGSGEAGADAVGRALAMATDLGLVDLQVSALNNRGLARTSLGDPAGAIADLERSIELARDAGVAQGVVRGCGNLSSIVYGQGDLARAFELHEIALAEAERIGIDSGIRWQHAERLEVDYQSGRCDDLLRHTDEWFAGRESSSPHFMDGVVRSLRALVLAARGEFAGALEEDNVQVELARTLDPQAAHQSLAHSSFVCALTGERALAEERLEKLLREWREAPKMVTFNPSELAFAAVIVDRADAFLDVASGALSTRWLEAASAFARGECLRAAELYREIGSVPNEAYARLAASDEANVRRALQFYRSVGATPYIKRAEALLPASA
jgi:tetratricopeptide (TPR) repeat protein